MKITQNSTTSKKAIILSVVLVLVAAAGVAAYLSFSRNTPTTEDVSAPTQEQLDEAQKTKQETIENDTETGTPSPKEETEPTPQSTLSLTIPYADTTRLTTLITGVNTGTCRLTLTDGTNTLTQDAAIQPGPSSSTCKGFSYTLPSAGNWTATVTATTESGLAGSATTALKAN